MNLMIRSTAGRYRQANKAEILKSAAEIHAQAMSKPVGPGLDTPRTTLSFLQQALGARESEVFVVLFLDIRYRLLAYDEMFQGTIDDASVHPREVAKRALELNAAAVILAHNHPSGVPLPSQADRLITTRLKEVLALLDVRVLDHLIVAKEGLFSFAEQGLI